MRIGIIYDLKSDATASADLPDDFQEEFDSPVTIEAISGVLRELGHEIEELGNGRELLERLLRDPPDFVFNIAEGHGIGRCREARVPAVLELLGIPYTGSDPFTLAAALDKDCARKLIQTTRVNVPQGGTYGLDDALDDISTRHYLPFTAIVKPAWEGSSKGIRGKCVVDTPQELVEAIETHRRAYRQPVLVEEYIEGEELTVGIVGNSPPRIVGVMQVLPRMKEERFVYSLEVKRDYLRQVRYECPAKLPPGRLRAVEDAALVVYKELGCRDVARIDFRMRDGIPYFLEVNPLPGLNPESSDLVILSRLAGWNYDRLIEGILQAALERTGRAVTAATTATT
jgi:D-alanine-D-alanine ligase